MSNQTDRIPGRLVDIARSIALNGWIIAAVGVPVTLALRAYSGLLLVLIVAAFWQVLAVFALWVLPVPGSAARCRFYRRLTRWGAVYFAVTALFCLLSFYWGINLLYLAAAFLLAGLASSLVLPRLTLRRTSAHWEAPAHIFAGAPFSVAVQLANHNRLLSACSLRVTGNGFASRRRIPRLAPGEQADLLVRQSLPERGMQPLAPITVQTGFPFGLFETSLVSERRKEVLVYPRLGRLHDDLLVRHKGGEARWLLRLRRKDVQGEFHSLREYKHGDNPRHIHWPTSARLNGLFVREFERQEMHSVLMLLDAHIAAGPEDEVRARLERFEKAVSFVATMGGLLTRQNVFFAFASCCPEMVALPYDSGPGHFYALLETLALAEPSAEYGLADLLETLSYHEVSTGGICLVTPGPISRRQNAAALGALAHCAVTISVSEPEFDEYFSI